MQHFRHVLFCPCRYAVKCCLESTLLAVLRIGKITVAWCVGARGFRAPSHQMVFSLSCVVDLTPPFFSGDQCQERSGGSTEHEVPGSECAAVIGTGRSDRPLRVAAGRRRRHKAVLIDKAVEHGRDFRTGSGASGVKGVALAVHQAAADGPFQGIQRPRGSLILVAELLQTANCRHVVALVACVAVEDRRQLLTSDRIIGAKGAVTVALKDPLLGSPGDGIGIPLAGGYVAVACAALGSGAASPCATGSWPAWRGSPLHWG